MNELQLSLIAAGVVVLLGVVGYNAWQGSKARARIPRRMPVDGAGIDATAGTPDADDDRPSGRAPKGLGYHREASRVSEKAHRADAFPREPDRSSEGSVPRL